ncbi:energy transducer TonB [Granulicella sibirica]|uniref:energy transducer TonB n=1 Tax=Granulicella sibirica TaxID=2479048 RepID=UPI001008FB43|nr:energy transducer TonB [Granulicella sibirica]
MTALALLLTFVLTMPCPMQEPTVNAPVRVSSGVLAKDLVKRVDPQFPKEAKRRKINGLVVLRVIIGTDGTVKKLRVISGPELLQTSFSKAVKQWVYKPYLINGVPVEVETTIALEYAMGGS